MEYKTFNTAPKDRIILAWHHVWKCWIAIFHTKAIDVSYPWITGDKSNTYPTESFTHWMEMPKGPE